MGSGHEAHLGLLERADGFLVAHRAIEDHGRLFQPGNLTDVFEQSTHRVPVLGFAADDFPAHWVAALVGEQHDAEAALVGHLGLGLCQLGHRAADALEVRVGHVHEQRTVGAIAVLVTLVQHLLQRTSHLVEGVERAMNAAVVKG